jgi:hypothetical protein
MGRLAIQLGKLGSILGALVGLIELSVGTQILPWIGNKGSPVALGFVTFILSGVAFLSILSARKHVSPTNDRKLAIFLGVLLPAVICFTTVGRLWYLPGSLLLLSSILLAYTYWFHQSKASLSKTVSRKIRVNQIIGGIGSLLVLASFTMAFFISSFGLFQSEILVKANLIRFQVVPMDIVRLDSLSANVNLIDEIEVSLVMFVYIFLILGAAIALAASLVDSRIFRGIGSFIVLTGLVLFIIGLPVIVGQTEYPSLDYLSLIGSLGMGWYISFFGMIFIFIASLYQFNPGNVED